MTVEEAKEFAKKMSYHNAVYNAMQGKCVPFRKATAIKLKELLSFVDSLDKMRAEIKEEITCKPMEMWDYRMGLTKALDIYDKYMGESGDKE